MKKLIIFILLLASTSWATVSLTDTRVQYSCNGSSTTYAYAFPILEEADLIVIKSDSSNTETVLTLNTDYTVTGAGGTGGNVVLTAGSTCASGYTLTIIRSVDYLQSIDLVDGEAFSAETLETGYDKSRLIDQDQGETLDRAVLLKKSSTLSGLELPTAVANKALCWDASASALTTCATTDLASVVFDHIGNYADLATAVSSIGASVTTLVIDEATVIADGTSVTIPSTLSLMIINGGSIDGVSGGGTETLTINGIIDAGIYKIFGSSLTLAGGANITIYYVEWWDIDGTADDVQIQKAIDFAELSSGMVKLIAESYDITATIDIEGDNIFIEGLGQGYNQQTGTDSDTAGTVLNWTGSAGGTIMDFGPASSATYGVKGGGISKVFFEGNESAGKALITRACYASEFKQITVSETTVTGIDVTIESTVVTDPGAQQSCIYDMITVIQQTAGSGDCIRLTGDATDNPSLNYFGLLKLLHYDGVALSLGSSDGNYFAYTSIFRHGSGSGTGVLLAGSNTSSDAICRKNSFGFLQTHTGGLLSQGTASVTNPAVDNAIEYYSLGNGSPVPSIGTGSTLFYTLSTGQKFGTYNTEGIFTPTLDFDTTGDLSVAYSAQVGRYIREGDLVHVKIYLTCTPTYTTASGNIKIGGLPFTSEASSAEATMAISGVTGGLTFGAGRTFVAGQVTTNSDYINLISMGSATSNLALSVTNWVSGTAITILVSGSYHVQ